MKITKAWLVRRGACESAMRWFGERYKSVDAVELLEVLVKGQSFLRERRNTSWAFWLVYKVMEQKQVERFDKYRIGLDIACFNIDNISDYLHCKTIIASKLLRYGIKILKEGK